MGDCHSTDNRSLSADRELDSEIYQWKKQRAGSHGSGFCLWISKCLHICTHTLSPTCIEKVWTIRTGVGIVAFRGYQRAMRLRPCKKLTLHTSWSSLTCFVRDRMSLYVAQSWSKISCVNSGCLPPPRTILLPQPLSRAGISGMPQHVWLLLEFLKCKHFTCATVFS